MPSTMRLLAGLMAALWIGLGLCQFVGADFELLQTTIDAGGGASAGSNFELTGTIAQPEANVRQSAGGEFQLAGGFWANASEGIFADGFEDD